MRVALLAAKMDEGGAERVAVSVANGLAARGYRTDMVLFRAKGAFLSFLDEQVSVVPLAMQSSLVKQFSADSPLRRYLTQVKPDLVLSFGHKMNRALLTAQKLSGWPGAVIISERNRFTEMYPNPVARAMRRLQNRIIYRAAARCLCISNGVKEDFLAQGIITERQAVVVYNPVAVTDADAPVSHEWFADSSHKIILGVGTLNSRKDFETLLWAFTLLCAERDDLRLVILGEGSHREKLERLAQRLKVADRVSLPGFVPNAAPYMAKAALLAMPSRTEGFGNVLVEALACGTNVVSTDCPSGPSEILDGGRYGRLTPVHDPEALARAIADSLADPMPAEKLKERAQFFSVAKGVKGYADLIEEVLRERRA